MFILLISGSNLEYFFVDFLFMFELIANMLWSEQFVYEDTFKRKFFGRYV